MTNNQRTILRTIANNPGCSMSVAAAPVRAKSHSPNQASFAAVHRCVSRGWVAKSGGQRCGLAYALTLTPAGEAALDGLESLRAVTEDAGMALASVLESASV